jgi:hypothetical protein
MIKLIDLLLELGLTDHYKDRKTDRITNIKKVVVPKEALGEFTLDQIQEPLIKAIQNIAFTKLKALESQDVPLSQRYNVAYKFLIPVLESNNKQYPITIVSDVGVGKFYYVIIYKDSLITLVLSSSDDLYKDSTKHLERKSIDVPVKVLEPEGATYPINLDELMGVEKAKEEKIKEEDLPYKVRTDYRIGANFEHKTYGTGKIVATSSGNRGTADSRGMLDWVEVDFGKPYVSGGKVLKTRKIPNIYSSIYFDKQLKDKEDVIMEIRGRKTLHVYDFDDTLVKTTTPVIVIDKDGNKKEITSHEFATHKLQPGEKYDFSKFDAAIKGSKPILKNLTQIFNSLENPSIKTTILTARRIAFPIMKHLRDDYGIDVYVIGVGSSDPEVKADWIEKQVEKGYNDIKFVDDSQKNLDAVEKRLARYPDLDVTLINSLK